MNATTRYLIDSDDDGHWYLVPEMVHPQFGDYASSEGELDQPEGVIRLGGHPNAVTFEAPLEFGEPIEGAR